MTRDTFRYLCNESEAGRDVFVTHPDRHEEGRVASCELTFDQLIVETPDGGKRSWDFSQCEEMGRMHELRPGG